MMNAFPTSETLLKRGKLQPCGLMFCLHGPRAVKFSAIWEIGVLILLGVLLLRFLLNLLLLNLLLPNLFSLNF